MKGIVGALLLGCRPCGSSTQRMQWLFTGRLAHTQTPSSWYPPAMIDGTTASHTRARHPEEGGGGDAPPSRTPRTSMQYAAVDTRELSDAVRRIGLAVGDDAFDEGAVSGAWRNARRRTQRRGRRHAGGSGCTGVAPGRRVLLLHPAGRRGCARCPRAPGPSARSKTCARSPAAAIAAAPARDASTSATRRSRRNVGGLNTHIWGTSVCPRQCRAWLTVAAEGRL